MKAVITIDQDALPTIEVERGGAKRLIHTNIEDLLRLLNNTLETDLDVDYNGHDSRAKVVTLSPTLPNGTMKYAKLDNGSEFLIISYPAQTASINYHNVTFENVPFPNLVFSFRVNKNRVYDHHVMAYKARNLREDTELFRFPFANVYQGGKLCYFDNQKITDLVELQSFCHNWLHTPMNDHLYSQKTCNTLDKSLREILESSQNKEFNYDMLVPANVTFNEWAKKQI